MVKTKYKTEPGRYTPEPTGYVVDMLGEIPEVVRIYRVAQPDRLAEKHPNDERMAHTLHFFIFTNETAHSGKLGFQLEELVKEIKRLTFDYLQHYTFIPIEIISDACIASNPAALLVFSRD